MGVNIKIVSQVVAAGTPGPVGKSAYQIAVENGFEGTEAEWLNQLLPFKGWYDNVSALEDAIATPSVGDYAYVKGATSSDPVKIYECSTGGTWSDSGRTVDTSTVQTFRSGEAVNDVDITGSSEDIVAGSTKLPTAGDVAGALGNAEFSTGEKVKNVGIDAEPTAGSENLVKSGGVAEMYGSYIYNSEYVYVKTDNENKILWAIKEDGSVFYGAGCPQQVKDYVQQKIDELSFDEYDDIVTFLSDYLEGDTTLKVIIDGINESIDSLDENKLDKEGLDEEALETVKVFQIPDYIQATTDSDNKILEGITKDGVKYINIPAEIGKATVLNIDSNKWIQVLTDSNGKIIEGITADGKKKIFVPTDIDGFDEDVQNIIENDFPNKTTTDKFSESDGKLMWNGSPIASEASISTLVVDLPVSDGTDVSSGYAYIDSTDRTIKVKA